MSERTVYMAPSPAELLDSVEKPTNGIEQVVRALGKWLPALGWRFVDSKEEADVTVSHAGSVVDADVVHCHGLYPTAEQEFPRWVWEVNRRVIESVRLAKAVSVPSNWVADLFARDMGFRPVVLRHGVDLHDWPEPKNIMERKPIVVWNKNRPSDVCSPGPVEKLARMLPHVPFISTYGKPSGNLQIIGSVPHSQMRSLLYQSQVYLATTKETFCIGALEAFAAGLPVVAWNWGNLPSIVRHGVNGYIAGPHDYEDTAGGIIFCLDNLERMSQAARARAAEFGWELVIEGYSELYHSVLEPSREPVVSFIVPCYNYASYVGEAIDSIRDQTLPGWECVVVDDGSTDNSPEVVSRAIDGDGRFKVFSQTNRGVAASRNFGAMQATGQYLCFLDADDFLKPRFLELLIPAIREDPRLGLVYGRLDIYNGEQQWKGPWPGEFDFSRQLKRDNQIPACNLMRRSAFLRTGGFRQRLAPAEDAELWTKLGLLGFSAKKATDESVYVYRVHGASASRRGKPEPNWIGWLPAANGGPQPFASLSASKRASHPVRNYDCPRVSVIIPVGDGHEDLVLDAIDSVLAQVCSDWELIVVDNTSKSGLSERGSIPYKLAYPFVKWLRCEGPNVSKARNIGARLARGQYLCFLDADDILLRDFLSATLPVAEESQGMVYTDWFSLPSGEIHKAEKFSCDRILRKALFAITFLHPKSAWEEVGGFDESLSGWEDWDYEIALAAKCYEGVHVQQALIGYRYDSGSRREDSLANRGALLYQFQEKWKGVDVACSGCKGRKRNNPAERRAESNPAPVLDPDMIEVEYVGKSQGAFLYKCPSGSRYRFGGGRHSRKLVRAEDADFFRRRVDFAVKKAPQRAAPKPTEVLEIGALAKPVEAVTEPVRVEIETEEAEEPKAPFDIPGVRRPLLELLMSEGFDLERLKGASPEDLLVIEGIGPATARRILSAVAEHTR